MYALWPEGTSVTASSKSVAAHAGVVLPCLDLA